MIEECLRVEFAVTGDDCPLSDASVVAGATTIECAPPLLRRDGNVLLRFSTPEADANDIKTTLEEDDRIRYLHVSRMEGHTNFRCLSKHPCVLHELIDVGFMVESLQYRNGTESYVGTVVGSEVLQGVLAAAGDTIGVNLKRVHHLGDEEDTSLATRWDITPAQEEALRAALEAGYLDVPRHVRADEVAADLDISKSAFLERLRRGQRGLIAQILN